VPTPNEARPRRVKVKGVVVRELREKQDLTRQAVVDRLAEMGLPTPDVQTLKRIEDRNRETYPVVSAVAESLAKLLGTKLAVLTGEEPVSDERTSRDLLPELSQPLPREFHNALAQVCFVYGVSPATVIANAPLTFAIMAQRNLDARSQSLAEMRRAVDEVESRQSHLGRLHVRSLNADAEATWADDVFAAEASSIAARDILGEGIKGLRHWGDEEDQEASPFLDYLRGEALAVGITTTSCSIYPEAALIPVPGEDGQDIISSAIEAMAGSDAEVKEAIAQADFIIPASAWKALRSASPERRIAALRRWMERDEYGARQREWRKQISDDLSTLLETAQEGDA
jgi:hypothetical protein